MFTIFFFLCLVGISFFFFSFRKWALKRWNWGRESDNSKDTCFLAIVFFAFAFIFLLINVLAKYSSQLSDFAEILKIEKQINIYQKRSDNFSDIIRSELKKYPDYEKEIIDNITPNILLKFPDLKSNETMSKTVNDLLKIQDDVYKLKADLTETQRIIFFREISPWTIYVTSYESFFHKKNPLTVE